MSRRPAGWALPARPPEAWESPRWSVGLAVGMGAAAVLPLTQFLRHRDAVTAGVVVVHLTTGLAALLVAYLLLLLGSVREDPALRWLAAGAGAVFLLLQLHSWDLVGVDGPHRSGAASVQSAPALAELTVLILPAMALLRTVRPRAGDRALLGVGALILAAAALAQFAPRRFPVQLGAAGEVTRAGRLAALGVGLIAAAGALAWTALGDDRRRQAPRRWVGAGLWLVVLVPLLAAAAGHRYDGRWWASLVLLVPALAVPAAGLSVLAARGYLRQARGWHRLEREVRTLRVTSSLLAGRSVTPEDDRGLPEARHVATLLEQHQVRVALQPVVELTSGATVGQEALARMDGRTPTDHWFRAAARCGLGPALERAALSAALEQLSDLPGSQFLAVNVSPAALRQPELVALLLAAPLPRLVVEITEHEAVHDYDLVRLVLGELRAGGARIAVDDMGAGFASLRHVLLLQPDIIKLDISLTREVATDERQRALVVALADFAGTVGTVLLAEGVEHQSQVEALIASGVTLGQGWHLGVPVTCPR